MVADILTKALPRDKHEKHMTGMGQNKQEPVGELPEPVGDSLNQGTS